MRSRLPGKSCFPHLLCVFALGLPGMLRANDLAFLHNGEGEVLRIHRLPSSPSQEDVLLESKEDGQVVGWVDETGRADKILEPCFSEAEGPFLTVPPGSVAGFAWPGRSKSSSLAQLRIVVGEGGSRRCFMSYRVEGLPGGQSGWLEPYPHFGPRILLGSVQVEGLTVPSFLGIEESKATAAVRAISSEVWPELAEREPQNPSEAADLEVAGVMEGVSAAEKVDGVETKDASPKQVVRVAPPDTASKWTRFVKPRYFGNYRRLEQGLQLPPERLGP